MSSTAQFDDSTHHGNKDREQRLADLSGAMALARLTHQVKELELETHTQDILIKPTFEHINCVMLSFMSCGTDV
jgi:hypothetical protein